MNIIKKAFAAALATSMIASSSYALAFSNAAGYYTYELKFEDSYGNKVDEVGPNSELYLSYYIYATNNANVDETMPSNKKSNAKFAFFIPKDVFKTEAVESYIENGMPFTVTATENSYSALVQDNNDTLAVICELADEIAENNIILSSNKPIVKIKVDTSNILKDFSTEYWTDNITLKDASAGRFGLTAKSPILKSASVKLSTEKMSVVEPTEIADSSAKGEFSYLKHVANVAQNVDATKKIEVTKKLNNATETQTTSQTIAELLGGEAVYGSTVTATISIGVLTNDKDAEFSFELK